MAKINFYTEEVNYTIKRKRILKDWLNYVVKNEKYTLSELNFILCSDDYLLKINQDFLQHDYYTDVITFDNSEVKNEILGDIFISLDRIKDNAKAIKISTATELHRIIIHGTLHLLGYKDKSKKDKQKMTEMEDFYLEKLNKIDFN